MARRAPDHAHASLTPWPSDSVTHVKTQPLVPPVGRPGGELRRNSSGKKNVRRHIPSGFRNDHLPTESVGEEEVPCIRPSFVRGRTGAPALSLRRGVCDGDQNGEPAAARMVACPAGGV